MKGLLIFLTMTFLAVAASAQGGNKIYEKTADKYSVNSILVLGRTFTVGDTITFLSGAGLNGNFVSVRLLAGSQDPLPANATGRRVIILKIFHRDDGLNTFDQLVCEYVSKLHIYIDPSLALSKKEIE